MLARKCRKHAVGNAIGQDVRPLADGLCADAYSLSGQGRGAAQKFDRLRLAHARLKHAFKRDATMLSAEQRKLAFTVSSFSDRLNEAFVESKRSREDLARVLRAPDGSVGVSAQAVGQALSGTTKQLTAENAARAAVFLGVEPYWLCTGEGPKRAPEGARQLVVEATPSVDAALPVALRAICAAPHVLRPELAQVLTLLATTGSTSYIGRVLELLPATGVVRASRKNIPGTDDLPPAHEQIDASRILAAAKAGPPGMSRAAPLQREAPTAPPPPKIRALRLPPAPSPSPSPHGKVPRKSSARSVASPSADDEG